MAVKNIPELNQRLKARLLMFADYNQHTSQIMYLFKNYTLKIIL
jgi:hypothetical protein